MYLKYLQIRNFRNLRATRFQFAEGANTIIGENDAGKTNAVTAMRILLDNEYYYNSKRLKETDFSFGLGNWRGHWIIISAFFDKMSLDDQATEVCSDLIPESEDLDFLKSFIRCEGYDYGVVTLFIRPNKKVRTALYNANGTERFHEIRKSIKLSDYEFVYTSRSQADFTSDDIYMKLVGDLDNAACMNPDDTDMSIFGAKTEILDIWSHISVVFIDALRDVEAEMHKAKNPIRRIVDAIRDQIDDIGLENIQQKVRDLNKTITDVKQISDIGSRLGKKMDDIIGLVYAPEITLESRIKEDLLSISKNLTVSTASQHDIDLLGLGHLNILFMALKLVEFEYNKNHEVLNIMVIEEPEAHIHTHIQKTLFDKLQVASDYTQVIMTTHSAHISEISNVDKVNIMRSKGKYSIAMQPQNGLDEFGKHCLDVDNPSLSRRLERYLDAKRSVLLFSKGVILVEGDAEEILIPAMVKQAFGVSLDEIGIGLINIGSVAFEYIACIFDEKRLQRRCAIITDLDAMMPGASKSKDKAAKDGELRKEKLGTLFGTNDYIRDYYSSYTFEVDLFEIETNRRFLENVINAEYKQAAAVTRHINALNNGSASRYDTILTVADKIGKGWLATCLAAIIDKSICIPDYIISALSFACGEALPFAVVWKMLMFAVDRCEKSDASDESYSYKIKLNLSGEEQREIIRSFCKDYPDDVFSKFIENMRANGDY